MTQVTPEHHEHARARVVFTLHDSQHLPGEIPLTALAGIAAETQTLIRRLARSLDERSGPGRTPVAIENATELLLVAVRPGSTVLDVVGPAPSPQMDLGIDIPDDIGTQALDSFVEGLVAATRREPLPESFDELSARSLEEWLDAMARSAQEIEVEAQVGIGPARRVRMAPAIVRGELAQRRAARKTQPAAATSVIEGRLYAVDLDSGRYRVRDDAGNSISVVTTGLTREHVAPLLDQRVRAEGTARFDDQGRLQSMDVTALALAPTVEELELANFFTGTDLDRLVGEARPLQSMSELAIADLPAEEIADFLAALRE